MILTPARHYKKTHKIPTQSTALAPKVIKNAALRLMRFSPIGSNGEILAGTIDMFVFPVRGVDTSAH
jgi:hypothetical protein